MVKVLFTCERCETTFDITSDVTPALTIQIRAENWPDRANHYPSYIQTYKSRTVHWCRTCAGLYGIDPKEINKAPDPSPTFEDLLKELIDSRIAEKVTT
jgi:hypothetical protein